jgi:sialate O-acetylesterase
MIPSMMRLRFLPPFCRRLSVFFVFVVLAACFRADVTLPVLLADHMVVQRGLPVHIWGMAAPAESVSASLMNSAAGACTFLPGKQAVRSP